MPSLILTMYKSHKPLHPSQVLDSNSFEELASYPGLHAKSRLFRQTEGGVTDLGILPGGRLYSCGADGSVNVKLILCVFALYSLYVQ